MKKLFAVLLATMLLVSLFVPASAATSGTEKRVIISTDDHSDISKRHTGDTLAIKIVPIGDEHSDELDKKILTAATQQALGATASTRAEFCCEPTHRGRFFCVIDAMIVLSSL